MEAIESKIKVDRSSPAFAWISSLDIQTPSGNFIHTLRDEDINGIIYSTCMSLSRDHQINPNSLQPYDLLTHTYNYVPIFAAYLCQYLLLKREVQLTPETIHTINQRILAEGLNEKFWRYIVAKISGSHEKYILHSSIMNLCFGDDVAPEFVMRIVGDLLPFESNLQVVEELTPGMNVCGITLVERLSKKEHSEVWKAAERGNRPVVIKLEPIGIEGKELNKMLKGKDSTKMIEYIQSTDEEFINFNKKLKSFPYKVESFRVDFYGPMNMKVKIISLLAGPIGKVPVENKGEFLMNMVNLLYTLHSKGIVHGDISINHIMINPESRID